MKKFLDLGLQPLANKYLTKNDLKNKKKEQFYHLEVGFDNKTKLVSILNKVPSQKMFDNSYPYRSSMSKTMTDSFKKLSKKIIKNYKPKLILEIGSNDGSLIKNFNKKNVICVEPCKNLAIITKNKGFKTYDDYWDIKLAKKIKSKYQKVDLIYSANTLSHIANLDSVFKSISYILSEDGILIIEDPSLLECLKRVAYDQFYNEHIYVFSLLGIKNIIKKYNFEVFKVEKLKTHGGSIRYFIKKKSNFKIKTHISVKNHLKDELRYKMNKFSTYIKFRNKVKKSKSKLIDIFRKIKKKDKKIIGYGSTAKSVTILNYCKIKSETLDYFVDTTPNKTKKYMPGTHIYIDKYQKNLLNNVDYIFLGAWNFKEEIFKKEKKFIKRGGKFITHIPIPKII
jgi:SAM-dependent methyltransferase